MSCLECWYYVPEELGEDKEGKRIDLCVSGDIPIRPESGNGCKDKNVMGEGAMPLRMESYWFVRGLQHQAAEGNMVLVNANEVKDSLQPHYRDYIEACKKNVTSESGQKKITDAFARAFTRL